MGVMAEKTHHDLYIDADLLEVFDDWAKRAGMSRNQFIISAARLGAQNLAQSLGILVPEETIPGMQPARSNI